MGLRDDMEDEVRASLVDRLMTIQRERGMTGVDMANALGVAPSTWTRLVKGEMQPTVKVFGGVLRAFPELEAYCVEVLRISRETDAQVQSGVTRVAV